MEVIAACEKVETVVIVSRGSSLMELQVFSYSVCTAAYSKFSKGAPVDLAISKWQIGDPHRRL